jgi:hypothetical protein
MGQYFSEISRVQKKGGRCLATYFLINPESEQYIAQGKSNLDFFEVGEGYFSTVTDIPERVIAQREDLVRYLYKKYGLSVIEPIHYGSWCGRQRTVDFQDIVIAEK